MKTCQQCNKKYKDRNPKREGKFCSRSCFSAYRSERTVARKGNQPKYGPMERAQALANAWLTNKPLDSLDAYTQRVFGRPLASEVHDAVA